MTRRGPDRPAHPCGEGAPGEDKWQAEPAWRTRARFTELMNAGPFSLQAADLAEDRYGRALFTVTRERESLGDALVREGLAEEWRGWRRGWC